MKNRAFTLAEVLITLGIIGVVTAMTLPALINKAEKMILKNQFKKAYSNFYNAVLQTVSYTHLDVYKRQVQKKRCSGMQRTC